MNNGLGRAITLAIGVAVLLLLLPALPQWWVPLSLLACAYHTIGLAGASRGAGKSPIRIAAFVHGLLLIAGTVGIVLFLESVLLHVLFTLLSAMLLALSDYHALHFLHLPSERSRTVLLFTTWMVQAYIVFVCAAALLGLVAYIHMETTWLLLGLGIAAALSIHPSLVFFEPRVPLRRMSTLVVVLVTVEMAWAVLFLPLGPSITALFVALAYALASRLALHAAGEFGRDNSHKWLYAGGVIIAALLLVLFIARWI